MTLTERSEKKVLMDRNWWKRDTYKKEDVLICWNVLNINNTKKNVSITNIISVKSLQDFVVILKHPVQNYYKVLKKCSTWTAMLSTYSMTNTGVLPCAEGLKIYFRWSLKIISRSDFSCDYFWGDKKVPATFFLKLQVLMKTWIRASS